MEFWKHQFDKILISGWLLLFTLVVLYVAHWYGSESDVFKWANSGWLFFSGLFAGLISGVALGRRATDASANGKNGTTPPATPTPAPSVPSATSAPNYPKI